jgi:hypothetical protein
MAAPHTEILVDTNHYSGNFESELSAWVFGVIPYGWDIPDHRQPDYLVLDPSLNWARENPDTYEEGALTTTLHEEYGPCWQQIEWTVGWEDDGHGHYTRPAAGHELVGDGVGACQSVRWVFTRSLSDIELASANTRILSFASEWTERMKGSNRADAVLHIEGLRVETRVETLRAFTA